jgi:acyl-CoA dehydrogenase
MRVTRHQSQTAQLKVAQALLAAVQLSGAMMVVFEQSLQHANQRQQFGKPIGKFQAIQHNLSLMAEQVFAARMAAQLACTGSLAQIQPLRVAVAKARTSLAAQQVTALAHGLHGAMGFTSEFDLQLRTRRIHAWRQCAGSESHWQNTLGESLLQHSQHSLDVLLELSTLPD